MHTFSPLHRLLASVPSRPTLFTGQYPDLHGVTKPMGSVAPDTRTGGFDKEKCQLRPLVQSCGLRHTLRRKRSHADLTDPETDCLATNTDKGEIIHSAVEAYLLTHWTRTDLTAGGA